MRANLILPIFFVMSLFVHSSMQWTHRQRGFINIPADFSFGSDSAYNLPDTSPATSTNSQQTSTYQTAVTVTTTAASITTQTSQTTRQQSSLPTTVKTSSAAENLIYGVSFDCTGKTTGFYKDPKYCDLFHVCVGFKQKKTYPCPQVGGDKFYYDEALRRCEPAQQNPNGCPANNYYQSGQQQDPAVTVTIAPTTTQAPVEQWRLYVRSKDPFTCTGKTDGFYASNWCNVFYRCYLGLKFEFLCAKQTNGDRLWWTQHSTSQSLPQSSAQCGFPCDLNRACSSPGGVLMDKGTSVTDSTAEASRIITSCASSDVSKPTNDTGSADDYFRLPESDNSCAGVAEGQFAANSKYCNIFHVCVGGKRKDFLCAKAAVSNQYELWWNDATKTCEWPCKVKCSKQIYGGNGRTAADIQSYDKSLIGADCDASSYYLRKWYEKW